VAVGGIAVAVGAVVAVGTDGGVEVSGRQATPDRRINTIPTREALRLETRFLRAGAVLGSSAVLRATPSPGIPGEGWGEGRETGFLIVDGLLLIKAP